MGKPQTKVLVLGGLAIFFGLLLFLATTSAGLQSAYAASFKYRVPPYSNPWSNLNNSCSGSPNAGDYRCAYSNTSGEARLLTRSYAYPMEAQARHNGDPPVANPDMYITQYRNLYFYSLLHGKFLLQTHTEPCCLPASAEMRYGGWTALKRPADGVWLKDYYFYVYKKKDCPGSCGSTTYTIPSTNVVFVKGYNAGHYSIASLFDAFSWTIADPPNNFPFGKVDAYTTSQGRAMYSDQLAIQWCDSGSC